MFKIQTHYKNGTVHESLVVFWTVYPNTDIGNPPELVLHYPDGKAETILLADVQHICPTETSL